MDQPNVLSRIEGKVGWIILNRPHAINSLSYDMVYLIQHQLKKWETDESIAIVCIYGAGVKGLCAGGDMRFFFEKREDMVEKHALKFFTTEYEMDLLIHEYPKPVMVYMDGIVMGGGVGLSVGASHRIVTEKTKWAMPEMNIGFFPDVGSSYFLNRLPGFTGRYLALTSQIISGADTVHNGAADYFMNSHNWEKLKSEIDNTKWNVETASSQLEVLLNSVCSNPPASTLKLHEEKINTHFAFDSLEEIVASLEKVEQEDEWASNTIKSIRSKSPTSLKVTLKQLEYGTDRSIRECFQMEMAMSLNFMQCPDFYEGVRAVLVDKDRNPHWSPSTIEEVTEDDILPFFQYKWKDGKHPLEQPHCLKR